MRELVIAGVLLSLLAGGGFAQKKYVNWKTRGECAELGYLLDTGQYDKAVARLEKAVAVEPSATDAWFYLGVSYRELGQREQAITSFEQFKTISDDPELKEVAEKYITDLKNS